MNILDHILAGHYPKDSLGRALVPMQGHGVTTICATDKPGSCPIVGWNGDGAFEYDPYGRWRGNGQLSGYDLLPPPPRKVEVKRWLVFAKHGEMGPFADEGDAKDCARCWRGHLVELTGSYEQEW